MRILLHQSRDTPETKTACKSQIQAQYMMCDKLDRQLTCCSNFW